MYEYSAASKTLDESTPLVTRADLLLICKEIDEDTAEGETTEFINTAHIFVCNYVDGYGVAASLLTQIEKYLAAHFATITYSAIQRQTMGPMSQAFVTKIGMGLSQTRYGQMAMSLDPTGSLENMRKRRISLTSIGSGILPSETSGAYG